MPNPQARILIAEDEAPLRNLVRMSLEAGGHSVIAVGDGEAALKQFVSEPVDLVILDVMMPKMDGFTVCEEIRKRSDVPVIMLTALGGTEDLVRGFELGADDYIPKPFTFKEVQARIQAILRRVQWTEDKQAPLIIGIGRVTIDSEAHEVFVAGGTAPLTPPRVHIDFVRRPEPPDPERELVGERELHEGGLDEDLWAAVIELVDELVDLFELRRARVHDEAVRAPVRNDDRLPLPCTPAAWACPGRRVSRARCDRVHDRTQRLDARQ